MANNCVTNWVLRGKTETILEFANLLTSLFTRKDHVPNIYGKTWLGNLAIALGLDYKKLEQENVLRGYADPDPYLVAALCMADPEEKPFTPEPPENGLSILRFSTMTAWERPLWLCSVFSDKGIEYGYMATDEFANFRLYHNRNLIQTIFDVHGSGVDCGQEFDIGEEDQVLDFLEKETGLTFDRAPFLAGDYSGVLEALDKYNGEHDDEEVYLDAYTEV